MAENTEDRGFKVKDKRKILEEANVKEATSEPKQKSHVEERQTETSNQSKTQVPPLPEINFSTFILSLSTSALMHLGELANPENNRLERNLPMAKQTIDLIDMLKKKTEGNLEKEEDQLITNLLYDLKLKYVAEIKKG